MKKLKSRESSNQGICNCLKSVRMSENSDTFFCAYPLTVKLSIKSDTKPFGTNCDKRAYKECNYCLT